MKRQLLIVENERFLLNDPCAYQIRGMVPEDCRKIDACLGDRHLPVSFRERSFQSAMERFQESEGIVGKRVEVQVQIPEQQDHEIVSVILEAPLDGAEGGRAGLGVFDEEGHTAEL